jgi:hypothetical protein
MKVKWSAVIALGLALGLFVSQLHAWAQEATPASGAQPYCMLPGTRCQEAITAFAGMMTVLDHPRCANCHGAFVVTDEVRSSSHPGEFISMIAPPPSARSPILGEEPEEIYPAAKCQECHDQSVPVTGRPPLFEGSWRQPIESRLKMWGGKGAVSVCVALVSTKENPTEQIKHINTDALITLGFEGKRGMANEPQPPPLDRAGFVTEMQKWLAAMEYTDQWPGGAEKSCDWIGGSQIPTGVYTGKIATPKGMSLIDPDDPGAGTLRGATITTNTAQVTVGTDSALNGTFSYALSGGASFGSPCEVHSFTATGRLAPGRWAPDAGLGSQQISLTTERKFAAATCRAEGPFEGSVSVRYAVANDGALVLCAGTPRTRDECISQPLMRLVPGG